MNKPLVSVIMPVYNGEKYIKQAVESVYEQGVSLELLVIDDGSTDRTQEVLSAYEGREDFRYIKNKENMDTTIIEKNKGNNNNKQIHFTIAPTYPKQSLTYAF